MVIRLRLNYDTTLGFSEVLAVLKALKKKLTYVFLVHHDTSLLSGDSDEEAARR